MHSDINSRGGIVNFGMSIVRKLVASWDINLLVGVSRLIGVLFDAASPLEAWLILYEPSGPGDLTSRFELNELASLYP